MDAKKDDFFQEGRWLEEGGVIDPLLMRNSTELQRYTGWRRKLRKAHGELREALFGTKLCLLYAAVPAAIAAKQFQFGDAWVFSLSLVGLAPLAERISFLSEQIAYYAGPTVGGLLNATCGNVPELIISLLALREGKVELLKWSLLGSVLSNLLLVLGSSLFLGGLANINKERPFNNTQAGVNLSLLLVSMACHSFLLLYDYSALSSFETRTKIIKLSRSYCVIMLLAYVASLFFQLKTHRENYEDSEDDSDGNGNSPSKEHPALGFGSAAAWLAVMTAMVAVLSEFVVGTTEIASRSWGVSTGFICIILLPLAGNAAEHAGAIIFAFKNKIDLTLGVTLGSSAQISMFVLPLSSLVGWSMGVPLDLDLKLLETASLAISVLLASLILQDGTWHYTKGLVLLLCYAVIGVLFLSMKTP